MFPEQSTLKCEAPADYLDERTLSLIKGFLEMDIVKSPHRIIINYKILYHIATFFAGRYGIQ